MNVAYEGECDPGPVVCHDNFDCADDEYCRKRKGRCEAEGVCEPRPEVCPLVIDPVCGCDGETYDNACEAAASGVSLEDDEACDDRKVAICHIPPGNPSKRRTLHVGESAVPAHLRHGDFVGYCEEGGGLDKG